MKNITIATSLLLLLASCGNTRERIQEKAETLKEKVTGKPEEDTEPETKPDEVKLTYESPFVNRQSKFIVIPTRFESGTESKEEYTNLYSSLLFFNPESGETNALDTTSYIGFIDRFSALTSTPESKENDSQQKNTHYTYAGKNTPNTLLFLEIANSELTVETKGRGGVWGSLYKGSSTRQNIYLATVNHDGKNFQPLTPNNSAVIWWEFIQEGSALLASAVVDTDNNGKIEDTDKIELFYTNLQKPQLGRTIIPATLQQALTSDYIKRKKEFEQKSNEAMND